MSNSCSFRITRTTEDLAQTLASISHRLVKLEKRLTSLEESIEYGSADLSKEEFQILDGVDSLLLGCNELLSSSSPENDNDEIWTESNDQDKIAA
tara:strand:- start:59 stop:343 length:285 start_codon:yes stop_codon:yes gene_type:complete